MDGEPGIDDARREVRLQAVLPWLTDVDPTTVRDLAMALVERTLCPPPCSIASSTSTGP